MARPRTKPYFKKPNADPRLARALLRQLVGQRRTLWGVDLIFTPKAGGSTEGLWEIAHEVGRGLEFNTAREAVIWMLSRKSRRHGHWELRRTNAVWTFGNASQRTFFIERPSRKDLADAIRRFRATDSSPSYARPDTLGWRTFSWSRRHRCLASPHQGTLWPTPEHIAEEFSTASAVRGTAGVHACRLPRGDWKLADRPADMPHGICIGLVERFGKFVLGTQGWRAEWVIIRELLAPNEAVARTLRRLYPEVKVHVAHPHHWLNQGVTFV